MELPPDKKLKPPIIPTLDKARQDLSSVIGKLLASFKAATIEAGDYIRARGDPDESFFSHLVRYLAKVQLRGEGIEAEDECELEQTANTGICITQPDYLIRVLRDTNSGCLPPAGDSERRKRFFAQQSEQFQLKYSDEDQNSADSREPVHITFLWASDQERHFTGLWFMCPNGESGAPHFQEFLPLPELQDLGLTETAAEPEEQPPTDLGMTRKDQPKDKEQDKPKTGTESSE
jgi:hypothetical protein